MEGLFQGGRSGLSDSGGVETSVATRATLPRHPRSRVPSPSAPALDLNIGFLADTGAAGNRFRPKPIPKRPLRREIPHGTRAPLPLPRHAELTPGPLTEHFLTKSTRGALSGEYLTAAWGSFGRFLDGFNKSPPERPRAIRRKFAE